jgi:acyl-CoA thioester hydrolase
MSETDCFIAPTLLAWDIATPFVQRLLVGAEHQDAFGHTNNVEYLRWLEQLAWAHSAALGLDMATYRALNAGCVARRHELDYLLPTYAGEALWLATWIHENDGRVSMWRRYQIIRESDGKTVMRGCTHWVCVDMVTGKPRRQPPAFLEAYITGRGAL